MDADFKYQYYDASVGFIYEYNVGQYYDALHSSFYSFLDFLSYGFIFVGILFVFLVILYYVREYLL